jgi:hypothetical protein
MAGTDVAHPVTATYQLVYSYAFYADSLCGLEVDAEEPARKAFLTM